MVDGVPNGRVGGHNVPGGGGPMILAETVAVVASDPVDEEDVAMTMDALRDQARARCMELAMMLLGRVCVLLAVCEVGIGGAIYR